MRSWRLTPVALLGCLFLSLGSDPGSGASAQERAPTDAEILSQPRTPAEAARDAARLRAGANELRQFAGQTPIRSEREAALREAERLDSLADRIRGSGSDPTSSGRAQGSGARPPRADVQRELGGALERLGDLFGRRAREQVEDAQRAQAAMDRLVERLSRQAETARSDYRQATGGLGLAGEGPADARQAATERLEDALRLRELLEEARRGFGPDDAGYYYNAGTVLLTEDPRRAMDELRRALELAPGDISARRNLALALERLGRVEEATSLAEETFAATPVVETVLDLGQLMSRTGHPREAVACALGALARQPQDPRARGLLEDALRQGCCQQLLREWEGGRHAAGPGRCGDHAPPPHPPGVFGVELLPDGGIRRLGELELPPSPGVSVLELGPQGVLEHRGDDPTPPGLGVSVITFEPLGR